MAPQAAAAPAVIRQRPTAFHRHRLQLLSGNRRRRSRGKHTFSLDGWMYVTKLNLLIAATGACRRCRRSKRSRRNRRSRRSRAVVVAAGAASARANATPLQPPLIKALCWPAGQQAQAPPPNVQHCATVAQCCKSGAGRMAPLAVQLRGGSAPRRRAPGRISER